MIPTIRTDAPFPRVTVRYALVALCYRPGFWHVAVSSGDPLSILSGSSMLVTGGTGSFGKAFIRHALDVARRAQAGGVLPRRAQAVRAAPASSATTRGCAGSSATSATGDRLTRAMHGVDYVVHAAALKQVDTAEYNPFEYVKTNITGSQNVIEAAIDAGVQQGRRALHRQGVQPDQPVRRDQAGRRQAVRRRPTTTPPATRPASPWCATATWWAAAARWSRSSSGWPREGSSPADHRQADDPLLDHAATRPCSSSSTPST